MTTIADATDDVTVEKFTQTAADLTERIKERAFEDLRETVKRQVTLIERYEKRLVHLREKRVIEVNLDLGGNGQ